jgi:hypothetical protein
LFFVKEWHLLYTEAFKECKFLLKGQGQI